MERTSENPTSGQTDGQTMMHKTWERQRQKIRKTDRQMNSEIDKKKNTEKEKQIDIDQLTPTLFVFHELGFKCLEGKRANAAVRAFLSLSLSFSLSFSLSALCSLLCFIAPLRSLFSFPFVLIFSGHSLCLSPPPPSPLPPSFPHFPFRCVFSSL